MIARLIRGLWIALLLAAVAAAWLSIRWFGDRIGPWAAGLLGVCAVAVLHPTVIALNFIGSRLFGDPLPPSSRLGPWRTVRLYDTELDASMRGLWFATPFLADRPAARPVAGTPLQPLPILFIHGYLCNRAVWLSFMRDAATRGYVCEAVTLPNPFASIETQVPVVDAAIDALLAEARRSGLAADRVALVGHSMGGLVAREAMTRLGVTRIGPVITLGSPHRGTHVARYATIPSVMQMRHEGPWLAGLVEREHASCAVAHRASMTTLYSRHDHVVYPQSSGALDGTHVIAIDGVGHVSLLYDRTVRSIVFERLAAWQAGLQAASQAAQAATPDAAAS